MSKLHCRYVSRYKQQDLEPFFSFVVKAAQSITNINESVETLTVCIFVQNVESPSLAALFPVLSRGLDVQVEVVTRTCLFER